MKLVTKFSDVKKARPIKLRDIARNIALTGLSIETIKPSAKIAFQKPRVQFIYIHHVFEDEIENFDKILRELSKWHTFISYSEAVDRILTNRIDKPYISISSDDGLKSNLKAAEILDKYDARGCFFINPDSIGLKEFDSIKNYSEKRLSMPPVEFLDWNDVDTLLKNGHEIGSHAMGHVNFSEIGLSELKDNLHESYEIIKSRCGKSEHFAYPYGRYFHFNQRSFDFVFEAGYLSCATAERGCHITDRVISHKELLIRRDQVKCDWSLKHIKYFLLNNSRNSSIKNNFSDIYR